MILTSMLEFVDRYEGQIFYKGSQVECEGIMNCMHAIIYNGEDLVLKSEWRVVRENTDTGLDHLDVGERWTAKKELPR